MGPAGDEELKGGLTCLWRPLVGSCGVAATWWIFQIMQPGRGPQPQEEIKGSTAQLVCHTLMMLHLSSLITAENEGSVLFIMGL